MIRPEAPPLPSLPLWLATLIALGTEAAVVAGLSSWPARPVSSPEIDSIEVSLVSASALADSAAAGVEANPPSVVTEPVQPPAPEPEPEPEPVEEPEPSVQESPAPVPLAVPTPAPQPVAVTPPKPKPTPKPKPKPKAKPKPAPKPPARPASAVAQTKSGASGPASSKTSRAEHVATGARAGKGGTSQGASSPAAYLSNPAPRYPSSARRQRQEGTVHLRVLVNTKGRPGEVRILGSSGVSSLDQAALRAVRRWRFKPAQQDGRPISAWVRIPVRFKLESAG